MRRETTGERQATAAVLLALIAASLVCGFAAWDALTQEERSRTIGMLSPVLLLLAAAVPLVMGWRRRTTSRLPDVVGGRRLEDRRGLRRRMALTLAGILGLPVALLAALTWFAPAGWLLADITVAFGIAGVLAGESVARSTRSRRPSPELEGLMQRLCLLADVPVPRVRVHETPVATAWAAGGAVHVTSGLLERLDPGELEAVLAHELVHLARGDALVMEIATIPSRALLQAVREALTPWDLDIELRLKVIAPFVALVYLVPALVLGGVGRLLAAGLSRGRELSADADAAIITGSPAALASALIKLHPDGPRMPLTDLRGRTAMSIVDLSPSRAALLRTHPDLATRLQRLDGMERRLQA